MGLTNKQRDYIEYMLTNAYTDEKDQRAMKEQLERTGKESFTEFTVSEASELITVLIERDVVYTLVCGEKVTIERRMAHSFDTMGESNACLDNCPKGVYLGSCKDYQKYEREMYKNEQETEDDN